MLVSLGVMLCDFVDGRCSSLANGNPENLQGLMHDMQENVCVCDKSKRMHVTYAD